jgi:adenylate cyclase
LRTLLGHVPAQRQACYVASRYAEAIDGFARISRQDHTHHAFLAAAYAQMGDITAATARAKEAGRLAPAFSAGSYLQTLHYKRESDREHHRKGLLEAGLPP